MLAPIPGFGPIPALTLAVMIDPAAFKSGRHLSARIGLTGAGSVALVTNGCVSCWSLVQPQ